MAKPYLITHMLTSLNGKIAGGFGNSPAFEPAWQAYEAVYRDLNADAWLGGRITTQSLAEGDVEFPSEFDDFAGDFIADFQEKTFVVSADPKGKVHWQNSTAIFGGREAGHLLCLVTHQADKAYLAHLRNIGVSYLIVGENELDLVLALDKLNQYFGIKRLVLAGGGAINGAFARQGLIDEIHLIVAPTIELGNEPTSFEQADDFIAPDFADFHLKVSRVLDNDILHLAYQK